MCSRISIGMHVLKGSGADVTLDRLAKTLVKPGFTAVASPVVSIVATVESTVPQVNGPAWLVMSLALGAQGPVGSGWLVRVEHAWAVNCCLKVVDVQPGTGSTTTDETFT